LAPDAVARLGSARFRHGGAVTLIEVSGDGKFILTGCADRMLRLWDADNGKLLKSWQVDYPSPVGSLSPDGKSIALCLDGEYVEVNRTTGDNQNPLFFFRVHDLKQIVWAPSGKFLATLEGEGILKIYDFETRRLPKMVLETFKEVETFCFAPDSTTLILARKNSRISVHPSFTDIPSITLEDEAPIRQTKSLFFLANGTLAALDEDKHISTWDISKGKLLGRFQAGMLVAGAAKTNDLLAVHDGTLTRYDGVKRKAVRQLGGLGEPVGLSDARLLAVTASGDRGYVAGSGNSFRILDLTTGKEQGQADLHRGEITGLAISQDGKTLLSTSVQGLCIWDLTKYTERAEARRPGPTTALQLPPTDGKLVLGTPNSVQIWEPIRLDSAKPFLEAPARTIKSASTGITVLACTPDGKQVAFADGQKRIVVADPVSGASDSIILDAEPIAMSYSPATRQLAVLTRDGQLHLRSTGDKRNEHWKKRVQRAAKGAVAFSPDGLLVASSSVGRTQIFEAVTGRSMRGLDRQFGDGDVHALAFSPDGRLLAVGHGGPQGLVRLWEVLTGKEVTTFRCQGGAVTALAFSPNGRKIVSGNSDATIVVWDVTLPSFAAIAMNLTSAWESLDSQDATLAYQAMGVLIRSGKEAVPLLRKGMKQALADQTQYEGWIRLLDDDDFKKRKTARSGLEQAGRRAIPALRDALEKKLKPEQDRLVHLILDQLEQQGTQVPSEGLFGEPLRTVRAIHVLEHLGGKEAMELLQSLAGEGEESRVKKEANAALGRMKR
jgi:WD40 repeat protein